MFNIYIDESGDLGFSEKSSKCFVIAALLTEDKKAVAKCISKIRKQKLHKKFKKIPELKYHNSDRIIRRRIIGCVTKKDVYIGFAVLRKNQVYGHLSDKPNILYNFLCGTLIGKIFQEHNISSRVNIIVDRSLTKINRDAFDEYVGYRALMNNTEIFNPNLLKICHVNSTQDKCIQAVDFIAGAVARKYNFNDGSLYEIMDEKVEIALDFFNGQIK